MHDERCQGDRKENGECPGLPIPAPLEDLIRTVELAER